MDGGELVPTALSQGESYHVFCTYSSTDYQWTHTLIQQLEQSGLRVCDHERDFTAGRPILNNMSESIQKSQKVLLVLSAEFVRSRWCLLEANMSMFRDCLQRKPIVPLLLQRDLPIPLPLAHLTYLDVHQPDFRQQLMRVLCTPNQEMQGSTVVPYQPPSFYNGKSLEPLPAVNEEQLNRDHFKSFDCGEWSESVPEQLRLIIQQPEVYQQAIQIINTNEKHRIMRELQKAVGQANSLLYEQNVLIGAQSNSKLLLVYVSVERCRQELSGHDQDQEVFYKAIQKYSCDYTCRLSNALLPFETTSTDGHLEGGVCFCEFVMNQMLLGKTRFCCCCMSVFSAFSLW
uniref:TIR domain-containing protein n=1 Tax=Knipowitschia caucasica TaxID=637954 RepID=A0AAV2M8D6_KNICA